MFSAIRKVDKKRVFSEDLTKQHIHKTEYIDPFLGLPVFFRKGHLRQNTKVRPHFVSKGGVTEKLGDVLFDPDYLEMERGVGFTLRESMEHQMGKVAIADWLKKLHPSIEISYEHRVRITTRSSYRIIDVAGILENGEILACECQISPILPNALRERIYDYYSEDIESIWFLGKAARTAENQSILYQEFGDVPIIDF